MAVVNKVLLSKSKELFDIEDADAQGQLLEIYTKEQVDDLLSKLNTLKIQKVDVLPTKNIDPKTLYLVPITPGELNNGYAEYLYINNQWEKIGTTTVDLSQYYTKSQVDDKLAEKQDALTIDNALSDTSTNPVENKAIKSAIDLKADTSTVNAALNDKADKDDIPTKTSDLKNDSNFIADPNYQHITVESTLSKTSTNPVQNKVIKEALDGKSNTGHGHTKSDISDFPNLANVATSGNYSDLSGKPTKVSDFTNDSGFITKAVSDLTNYYTKTNTYTKTEVDNLLGNISSLKIEVVQTLPTKDISTSTIYLVPATKTGTDDSYDEYIYVSSKWEKIGNTRVDLSDYYTKSEVDAELAKKQNTVTFPISIANGGTGKTTAKAAQNALLSGMNEATSEVTDDTYITHTYVSPSDSNGAVYKRKVSYLWNYIKGKANSLYAAIAHTHSKSDITDFPSELPADGGTSDFTNILNAWTKTRQTVGNIEPKDSSEYGTMKWMIASSTMTDSAHAYDGFLVTFFWDNSGRYDSQLLLPNTTSASSRRIKYRTYDTVNKEWRDWKDLMFSSDISDWAKATTKPTYTASEVGAYSKPSGGIPKTDLATEVQTSLGKADTALQSHQDISGKLNVNGSNATAAGISTSLSVLDASGATSDIKDDTQIITSHVDGYSTTNKSFYRRTGLKFWNYIKSKLTTSTTFTDDEKTSIRTAIGAGTSNLGIGTTSSTAAAGNHTHTNLKLSNHDTNNTVYYPTWANGKGDGSSARTMYTSTDLNYIPATGEFKSKKFTVDKKLSLEWNSTTQSLDFIFN